MPQAREIVEAPVRASAAPQLRIVPSLTLAVGSIPPPPMSARMRVRARSRRRFALLVAIVFTAIAFGTIALSVYRAGVAHVRVEGAR